MKNYQMDECNIVISQRQNDGYPYTIIHIIEHHFDIDENNFDCVYICDGYDDINTSIKRACDKYKKTKREYEKYNR